jgi:hypothetical protein
MQSFQDNRPGRVEIRILMQSGCSAAAGAGAHGLEFEQAKRSGQEKVA